jgi:hypothetical protein
MNFGLMLPNKGHLYGDANLLIELAGMAEESGWEGFFLWDHIGGGGDAPTMDPWLCLGAIAAQTKTMRLGTMITPLARRRSQKVAREIVTLDHISHGRAVLGVGLGDMVNKDFKAFGDETGPRTRAEMLDESLEIIAGLQSGKPFQYTGKHYQISDALFKPTPIQKPRVPVWVSAHWPFKRPLNRAARWDGVLPRQWGEGPITPDVIRKIATIIFEQRKSNAPFDIIKYGVTDGKRLAKERAMIKEYEAAGVTWWIEEIFSTRGTLKQLQARIAAGPPR